MFGSEGLRPKFWIRLTCPEVAQRWRQLLRVIEPLASACSFTMSYLAWPPFQILELKSLRRCSLGVVPISVPYFRCDVVRNRLYPP
jgi:hypothetical protein